MIRELGQKALRGALKALGDDLPPPTKLAVELPFPNDRRVLLDPDYILYQQDFDVRRVRAETQTKGYGLFIVELLVNQSVGPAGARVSWEDSRLQELWDNWEWNPKRSWERSDEAQRDAIRGVVRDGEALIQIIGGPDYLNLVFLDPLDLPAYPQANSITYDARSRPVEYIFRPRPGFRLRPRPTDVRLPARDIIHLYREDFPGQNRGISWLRNAVDDLINLREFDKDFREMASLAAAHPGFFELPEKYERILTADDTLESLERTSKKPASSRSVLPSGTRWQAAGSPQVTAEFYHRVRFGMLAEVARVVGISPITLIGDVADANFSSLRHAHLENISTYRRTQALAVGFVNMIADVFYEWTSLRYGIANGSRKVTPAGFGYIDPSKEVSAQTTELNNATRTRSEIIAESGRDPESVFAELAAEEALLRRLRQEAMERESVAMPTPPVASDDDDSDDSDDDDDLNANIVNFLKTSASSGMR